MGRLCHTAPSLRLFIPNSLTVCHLSFLSWLCLQHHFHMAWLLPRRSFSIHYIRSLLRPARPEWFPNQLPASLSYHSHPNFSSFLSIFFPTQSFKRFFPLTHTVEAETQWSGRCSHIHISGLYSACSSFFRFRGGLPFRKVHILILRNQLDVSFARFTISSLKVFPSIPSDVLLILRCSCRLVRGSFIPALPCSCHYCHFSHLSLMPLLHFVFFKRLFFFVRPFQVLSAMLSSPCFCNPCSVPCAIFALRVILPAAANAFRGIQFTSVQICLTRSLFHHATVAWRDTFLQAAANLLWDP
jgi:hypothetical protein